MSQAQAVAASTGIPPQLRLAELVAALSLGIDLGFGQPMEHVIRQCLIASRMAGRLDLTDEERSALYYTALLVNVACHTDAHEQAKWFGDDIALKSTKYVADPRSLASMAAGMRLLGGSGNQPLYRFRVGFEFMVGGRHDLDHMIESHAALARALAHELGLSERVQEAVASAYERWDGKGWPGVLKNEQVPFESRLAQLAEFVEVAHRVGGVSAAVDMARKRAGGQFDPQLAQLFAADAEVFLDGLDAAATNWQSVIDAEPALRVRLTNTEIDTALTGVADFVDLKSPYMLGHARAVADLVTVAAQQLGMNEPQTTTLRRAALLHGLGRLGVSNAIWDKRGPLAAGEWERVRMHPYLTERMLHQSEWLAPLGAIAVQLRERLDGSGYPRGLSGAAISTPARVLAAADVYQSMTERRPHREALPIEEAVRELRAEVTAGRLDGDAVSAVLTAAGHAVIRRRTWPCGLTDREADVLRLLAQGLSSRQIAERLVISPKTARNHIEHIYGKIGASTRATASLFAMQNGLLPERQCALN